MNTSAPAGVSALCILRQTLDNIERATGYRPVEWMKDIYKEAYRECITAGGFDSDGFRMYMSCVADSFCDFARSHYQHLNNTL